MNGMFSILWRVVLVTLVVFIGEMVIGGLVLWITGPVWELEG